MFRRLFILVLAVAAPVMAEPPSPLQADQKDPAKLPKVYVVPFGLDGKGQMGTDIRSSIFEKVVKDIKEKKPDLIVLSLDSAERGRKAYSGAERDSLNERGLNDNDDMRKTLAMFKKDLGHIPQVMWVQDSVGFGTLFALAWPHMYTRSDARIAGIGKIAERARSNDHEVGRKWLAAAVGSANGFLESAGRSTLIGWALMDPERTLSVSFKGRQLEWRGDAEGTFIIDDSTVLPCSFDARSAEDFGLSGGTADSLDELMFMMGYRAYDDSLVKSDQDGTKIVRDYITAWRKALAECEAAVAEYQRYDASGDPKDLLKARKSLETVLANVVRYPAIEPRLGMSKSDLESEIRKNKEKTKARKGGSSGGGGGMSR